MANNPKGDGELLADFVATRSTTAFEELVRRHGPMLYNACLRALQNPQDAEDAAQAAFLVLADKAPSLTARTDVSGWLHRVGVNICRNARRTARVRRTHEREAGEMRVQTEEDRRNWERLSPLLDEALAALPGKYRRAIVLFHLEGRSLEETAQLLGAETGAVGMRLSRGREMLRSRLGRRGLSLSLGGLLMLVSENALTAELPSAFATATAKAVALAAPGSAVAGGMISAKAAGWAATALKAIFWGKIKAAAVTTAATAAVVVSVLGGGTLLADGGGDRKPAAKPPAPKPVLEREVFPVKVDGKWGFIDRKGKLVLEPRFDLARPACEGMARVREDGKWGYVRAGATAKVMVEPRFVAARDFSEGLAAVKQDGKWSYIDRSGKKSIPADFARARSFSEGLAAAAVAREENAPAWDVRWGYINRKGAWVIKPTYRHACEFGDGLAPVAEDWKVGYIDRSGKTVIECRFYRAESFRDGISLVTSAENVRVTRNGLGAIVSTRVTGGLKSFFIDRAGRPLPPPPGGFMIEEDLSEKLTPVNRRWQKRNVYTQSPLCYLNAKGAVVLKTVFREGKPFSEGLAAVTPNFSRDRWGYIDRSGKLAIPLQFSRAGEFRHGLAMVGFRKHGFLDLEGKTIIAEDFERAHGFSEGLAAVMVGGEWGFIDPQGKAVIQPQFEEVRSFSDGLAGVRLGGEWGFIDPQGRMVIKPRFKSVLDFHEERAAVRSNYGSTFDIIDKKGTFISRGEFSVFSMRIRFSGGRAMVRKGQRGSKSLLIDRDCKVIAKVPGRGLGARFAEGLCRVSNGSLRNVKYGYIDAAGKAVVEPVYQGAAEIFSQGLAWVKLGHKRGFIDRTGKLVIPAKFDDAGDFREGLAPVRVDTRDGKPGRWGYIDKAGKWVLEPRFDRAESFSQGRAWTKTGQKAAFIDRTGKVLFTLIDPGFGGRREERRFAEGRLLMRVEANGYIDRTGKFLWCSTPKRPVPIDPPRKPLEKQEVPEVF